VRRERISRKIHQPVDQNQVARDFDALATDYEAKINDVISFGGREHQFYIDVKRDALLALLREVYGSVSDLTALDLGCGLGAYHPGLKGQFRALHGIDVSSDSIEMAKKAHPDVQYASYDGHALPYPNGSFDAIFTICVMHHVPQAAWPDFVAEIFRKLRPGGTALVFEHNPYNPATQYIVRSCDIDKDAVLLKPYHIRRLFRDAGFSGCKTRTILSVPPTGTILKSIDSALGHLPFGAQYYLKATKPA
jgi:ubiquinone/menaquinone biosynthesis C-methylase UbiE